MPAPITDSFVSTGLTLRHLCWGSPDQKRLVMLHGGRDHARAWDEVGAALGDDWHVHVPDLRGHGDSDWSPDGAYEKSDYLHDLHSLLQKIGADPVVLLGHSLGANIAVRYAAAFPERVSRLVLIEGMMASPTAQRAREARKPGRRLRDAVERRSMLESRQPRHVPTIEDGARRLRDHNPRLTAAWAGHLALEGLRPDGQGYVWKFDPRIQAAADSDLTESDFGSLLAEISAPVLLIYGSDSTASRPSLDGRLGYFRDAREHVVPDSGHWPHHDHPAAVTAIIRVFLQERDPVPQHSLDTNRTGMV